VTVGRHGFFVVKPEVFLSKSGISAFPGHDKRMNKKPLNMVESFPRRGNERLIGMACNSG
jgi:hypothetical protein